MTKPTVAPKKKNNKKKKIILSIFSFLTIIVFVGAYFIYQYILDGLPSLEQLENPTQSLATNVYSSDEVFLANFPTKHVQYPCTLVIDHTTKHIWTRIIERIFGVISKF